MSKEKHWTIHKLHCGCNLCAAKGFVDFRLLLLENFSYSMELFATGMYEHVLEKSTSLRVTKVWQYLQNVYLKSY